MKRLDRKMNRVTHVNAPKLGALDKITPRAETYTSLGNYITLHQKASAHLQEKSHHHKPQYVNCPFKITHKRMLYECPRCHRHRSYIEDRDQFILYGVTRLWPIPPPAPPTLSAPAQQAAGPPDSSTGCLERTYNICRIFHAKSAKLHPRTIQKKAVSPSPGQAAQRSRRNKVAQRRRSPALLVPNPSPCSSPMTTVSDDLRQMVDFLRRFVSPRDREKIQLPVTSSSNKLATLTNLPGLNQENTTWPSSAKKTRGASSPKRSRRLRRRASDGQSLRTASPFSSSPSLGNSRQSISPATLELWTKRLRSGACLKDKAAADVGKSATSGNSGRMKKKMRKKNPRSKRTKSKTKSIDTPLTNSVVSFNPGGNDKSSARSSVTHISGASSPLTGARSPLGEKLTDVIILSSRAEAQKYLDHAFTLKRACSFPSRPALTGEDILSGIENRTIVANIEAVKIDEEKMLRPRRKASRRRIKKSSGLIKLEEIASVPAAKERLAISAEDMKTRCSPRHFNDPVTMLEEFKSRMEKCQGKGSIKPSHIEVMAYLEGKRSDTKFQSLPKTYQQMGLAPLVRSPSSENCLQHLKFTCALGVAEKSPKPSTAGKGHKMNKMKKKKRNKSTSNSSSRNNMGETIPGDAREVKSSEQSDSYKQETKVGSPRKQRSQTGHRIAEATTKSTVKTSAMIVD